MVGQTPPVALVDLAGRVATIVSSTRLRAIESARLVAGARTVLSEAVFVEAPLPPPPMPRFIRLPPRWWGVLTRFTWWFFDLHLGAESRSEAEVRACLAADRLVGLARLGDVMLVAHGFFNTMVARELRGRGWAYAENQGWKYWSAKRFDPPGD